MAANKYHLKGKSQVWEYNGGCQFQTEGNFHLYNTQWHHPISSHPEVGCDLCQACHSLLMGRKTLYPSEGIIEPIEEKRQRLKRFIVDVVIKVGYTEADIDKR